MRMERWIPGAAVAMLLCVATRLQAQAILVDTYVVETGLADGAEVWTDRTSFESDGEGNVYVGLVRRGSYALGDLYYYECQGDGGAGNLQFTDESHRNPPVFHSSALETRSLTTIDSIGSYTLPLPPELAISARTESGWSVVDNADVFRCSPLDSGSWMISNHSILAATPSTVGGGKLLLVPDSARDVFATAICGNDYWLLRFDEDVTVVAHDEWGLDYYEAMIEEPDGVLLFFRNRDHLERMRWDGAHGSKKNVLTGNEYSYDRPSALATPDGALVTVSSLYRAESGYLQQDLRLVSDIDAASPLVDVLCEDSDDYCAAANSKATGASPELKGDLTGGQHLCFQDTAILSSSKKHPGQWRHAYRAPGSEEWVFSTIFRQRSPHLNQGYFEFFEMYGFTVSAGGGYLNTVGQIRTCEGTTTVRSHEVLHMRAINFGGLDVAPSPRASIGAVLQFMNPSSASLSSWDGNNDEAIDVADYVGRVQ